MILKTLSFLLFLALGLPLAQAQNPPSAAQAEVKAKPKPHLLYDAASDLKRLRGGEIKAPPEATQDDDDNVKPEDLLRDDHINPPSAPLTATMPEDIIEESPDLDDYFFIDLLNEKTAQIPTTNH